MFTQLFGSYLVENNILDNEKRLELCKDLSKTRAKMGAIAVNLGMLSKSQAEEINHIQVTENKRFGDIAIEKGYLTADDIDKIMALQGNEAMKFIQLLGERTDLSEEEIEKQLMDFKKKNGFSDREFEAVKADDISVLVDLYCPTVNGEITKLINIALNNITRFVSTDFYFDRMKKAKDIGYKLLTGLKLEGDADLYMGFAALDKTTGITEMARDYARDVELLESDDIYDAIGEFANMTGGLFSSEGHYELYSPKTYANDIAVGNCNIIPVYLHNKLFHIVIGSGDFEPGHKELTIKVKKSAATENAESGKKVLLADDSNMMRKILRNILEGKGYSIVGEASNGQEAVDLYKELKPDVVTLDITMPVMDGLKALENIVAFDKNAKVVMLSAAGQQSKIISALKTGAKLFITKPFTDEDVLKNIDSLF